MDAGRVRFFFGEVWRNFTRNLLMQVTATGTVAVTIVLLGAFLFARNTLADLGNGVLDKIEISVFLNDDASAADAQKLAAAIGADRRVRSVTRVSRAEGLRELRDRFKGLIDTSLLPSNPLPEALRVRVIDPNEVSAVAAAIRKRPQVHSVEYAADAVQKSLRVADVLGHVGLFVVALLIFTAAIIISNTIRLTVFARRREIAIMQLVGASGGYIRLPFIVEGLLAGTIGAALALGILELARLQLVPKLASALSFIPIGAAATGDQVQFALQLLGVGAAVGIVASWFSVNRYLRT